MKISAHQLKVLAKKYACQHHISVQEVLQNYMLERVLFRISLSRYSNQIILKGGLLITSLIGLGDRTTMDMDANVRGIELDPQTLRHLLNEVLSLEANDGIHFEYLNYEKIREHEEYEGLRFKIVASLDNLKVSLSVDFSTGDIITPDVLIYDYPMIFTQSSIRIMTYSIESILAEKLHAILELNGDKGRMKDYYDIHYFVTMKSDFINYEVLKLAVKNTFGTRNSLDILDRADEILNHISFNFILTKRWNEFSQKHAYSKNISYQNSIDSVTTLLRKIE